MSELYERIGAVLSSRDTAAVVAQVKVEAIAEMERITIERNEIEAEALDPMTTAETVQQRRAQCADLDFELKRLGIALERLTIEHEAALARDEQATRQEAFARAADAVAAAGKALEERGTALADELRGLILDGEKALAAMDAANAALPKGAKTLTAHPFCERVRHVPERIVSSRLINVWLDEKHRKPVSEDRLSGESIMRGGIEEARAQRISGIRMESGGGRALYTQVREVTFIPAHRFDWLADQHEPAPQTRLEDIPDDLMKARNDALAA